MLFSRDGLSNEGVDTFFNVGMWWRTGYGVLKLCFGIYLLQYIGAPLADLLNPFIAAEIANEPYDHFVRSLSGLARHHPHTITYFLAIYFIFWGIADAALSFFLLKRVLWAFPVSLVVIGLFVIYEIVRVTHTRSLLLLSIILLDIVIMYLIHAEYRKLRTSEEKRQSIDKA